MCRARGGTQLLFFFGGCVPHGFPKVGSTLLKQTIEKSIYKDCGEGKVLIRLKIQS